MKYFPVILVLVLLLAACGNVVTPISTSFPTQTIIVPTQPINTSTATRAPSITPTETYTLIPAIAFIPTIPAEAASTNLVELLHNNGGCKLPCWWGLTPGESMLSDAYSTLYQFSSISALDKLSPHQTGFIYIDYSKGDFSFDTHVEYFPYSNAQTIELISVSMDSLLKIDDGTFDFGYDLKQYKTLSREYSISQLLTTYGPPSQVFFQIEMYDTEPTAPDFFYYWLLYPKEGIYVRYESSAKRIDDKVQGCPNASFIKLWLLPKNSEDAYQEILTSQSTDWKFFFDNPQFFKSTDEAINMTLETFYSIFKNETRQCVETLEADWPPRW